MAFKEKKIQLEIDVSTQKAVREIARLQHEFQDLQPKIDETRKKVDKTSEALEKFSKADRANQTDAWKKAYAKYAEADKAYRDLKESADKYSLSIEHQVKEMGVAALTNKQLNRYYTEQKRALDGAIRGTEKYEEALKNLHKAQAEKDTRRTDIVGEKSLSQNLKGGFMPALIGGVAGGAVAMAGEILGKVFGAIGAKIEQVISKSDRMTDLANAIHGTTEEANQLNAAIGKIDTRIDMKTRRDIATEAGKLDVPTNQIVAYTEAMSEAVLVMESDFPDGAGKMTEVFTKIKGLYKDTKDLDYPTSVKNIGSALKGLADDGTATAKWSSEFLLRLGALDEGVRPTVTQLLGLGAALEESGLTDEIAASGVQNVLSKAYKNTEGFAKFFGQSKKDFEAFINLNPNEFLFKFAERLKPLSSTQKMQALQALGVESQEAAKVLGVLINKTDEVAEKQAKANSFFIEGTRLTELYASKNDNLAGKVERAGNKMAAAFSNSALADTLAGFIGGVAEAVNATFDLSTFTDKLTQEFNEQKSTVNKLETSIVPLLNRYDDLKSKTALSKTEQSELQRVIQTLAGVLPSSAIQFDNYGKAIGVSTDQAREFIKVQKAVLKAQNAELINSLEKDLKAQEESVSNTQRLLEGKWIKVGKAQQKFFFQTKTGFDQGFVTGLKDAINPLVNSVNEEKYAKLQSNLSGSKLKADELKNAIKGLSGELLDIPTAKTISTKPPVTFNPDDLKNGKKGSNAKTDAEKLAEAKIQAEAKANAEILKMRVEQIVNENDKKEAQIRLQYNEDIATQKKLVEDKKLSQATFDAWIIERNRVLDKDLADNDADANKKALEAAQKVNLEYAESKLKGEIDTQKKALKNAQKSEDLARAESTEFFILQLDYELSLLTANAAQKLELERKYQNDKDLLREKYDGLAADKTEKQLAKEAKIKEKLQQKQQKLYADIQKGIGITGNLVGEFFNAQKAAIDNEQIQEDKRYNKKIQNLEAQKNQGVITEQEYQDQKAGIEQEHNKKSAEIKKKAWEADKQARIGQIIIETARAVVASLPNIPLSIISGVTGAAQLAIALSQEPPNFDAYAQGGFTDTTSQKFSKLPTSTAKWAIVNEDGPEFIANNKAVNAPEFPYILPILRKMNTGQTVFPDLQKVAAQMQIPQFRKGDFTGTVPTFTATNTAPQSNNTNNNDAVIGLLLQAVNRLNDTLEAGIDSRVMFSHKHADDFNELLTINQDTRKRASANQNGNINK